MTISSLTFFSGIEKQQHHLNGLLLTPTVIHTSTLSYDTSSHWHVTSMWPGWAIHWKCFG